MSTNILDQYVSIQLRRKIWNLFDVCRIPGNVIESRSSHTTSCLQSISGDLSAETTGCLDVLNSTTVPLISKGWTRKTSWTILNWKRGDWPVGKSLKAVRQTEGSSCTVWIPRWSCCTIGSPTWPSVLLAVSDWPADSIHSQKRKHRLSWRVSIATPGKSGLGEAHRSHFLINTLLLSNCLFSLLLNVAQTKRDKRSSWAEEHHGLCAGGRGFHTFSPSVY